MFRKPFCIGAALFAAFLAVTVAAAAPKPVHIDPMTGERLPVQLSNREASTARDQDDWMTLRYFWSGDGGETWNGPFGAGDHGMYEDDGTSAWGEDSYDFGVVVDNDNVLHFIVVLDAFNPDNNPMERANGVYDVAVTTDGEATYTLIDEEGNGDIVWADAGKDADGNLYAIFTKEGQNDTRIWAARTTNGQWRRPVQIVTGLPEPDVYAHMTENVTDYFYVLYQIANEATGLFDHYVAKVPASLEGEVTIANTGVSSGVYFSYYVGSVNPIAQASGWVYFAVRAADLTGTTVGFSQDGENWQTNTISGAQRYPSMGMDEANGLPYVFSNPGVPAGPGYHRNWYTWDDGGYNGGLWVNRVFPDSVEYDGTRFLLYCHNGVWTPAGSFVRGCNLWGQFTPEAYQVRYWAGDGWSEPNVLWSIWDEDETFVGGFIAQNHLAAGPDDNVWVAFCGKYGETDFDGPECETESVSSYMLGEPKVVTASIIDETGVDILNGNVWLNWMKRGEGYDWEAAGPDSMLIDDDGNGLYFFHLPDSVHFFMIDTVAGDTTDEMRILEEGDEVEFYVDAFDVLGNYGAEHNGDWTNIWTVNRGIEAVGESPVQPTGFSLEAARPNPFNSATVIPFTLDRAANVRLAVYDLTGRLVGELLNGRAEAGRHEIAWKPEGLPTGLYLYTLEASGVRLTGKLALVR